MFCSLILQLTEEPQRNRWRRQVFYCPKRSPHTHVFQTHAGERAEAPAEGCVCVCVRSVDWSCAFFPSFRPRWLSTSAPVLSTRKSFSSTTPSTFLSTLTSPHPSDATLTCWSTGCWPRPSVGAISTRSTVKRDCHPKRTHLLLSPCCLLEVFILGSSSCLFCLQNAAPASA